MAKQTLYMCDLCLKDKLPEEEITLLKLPRLTLGARDYDKSQGEVCNECAEKIENLFGKIYREPAIETDTYQEEEM